MGDADRVMGLLQPGEDLSTFFRAQRKVEGILNDGILVLTTKRVLWVEETGEPIASPFAETVGAVSHERQLALRFRANWLSLYFPKAMIASDAERQLGVAINAARAAAARPA